MISCNSELRDAPPLRCPTFVTFVEFESSTDSPTEAGKVEAVLGVCFQLKVEASFQPLLCIRSIALLQHHLLQS
jgi:hypothetical protein